MSEDELEIQILKNVDKSLAKIDGKLRAILILNAIIAGSVLIGFLLMVLLTPF